jgi:hypothetical protein
MKEVDSQRTTGPQSRESPQLLDPGLDIKTPHACTDLAEFLSVPNINLSIGKTTEMNTIRPGKMEQYVPRAYLLALVRRIRDAMA